jgi:hypothetical protein
MISSTGPTMFQWCSYARFKTKEEEKIVSGHTLPLIKMVIGTHDQQFGGS